MPARWGPILAEAVRIAEQAYSPAVHLAYERATQALADDSAYLGRCFDALSVSFEARTLYRLKALADATTASDLSRYRGLIRHGDASAAGRR
ncbi:hypothetical protein [uncultured Lamprocystis sp.]|jgi:hypothetical protein|nr:hypothetical protein [uncultured Lamprocystis sp.]